MTTIAHRITINTRNGAHQIIRVIGAQDQDMAVIKLRDVIGDFTVKGVETIDSDASYGWAEQPLI